MHMHVYVYMYRRIHIYIDIHVYVYVYIYIYVHISIYIICTLPYRDCACAQDLMNPSPDRRLGSGGAQQVRSHRWPGAQPTQGPGYWGPERLGFGLGRGGLWHELWVRIYLLALARTPARTRRCVCVCVCVCVFVFGGGFSRGVGVRYGVQFVCSVVWGARCDLWFSLFLFLRVIWGIHLWLSMEQGALRYDTWTQELTKLACFQGT